MGKNDKALASKINTELAKKFEEASKKKVSISDFITDFIGQLFHLRRKKHI
jgi:hypothetical protein